MGAASCFETLTSPCGQGELLSMRPIEALTILAPMRESGAQGQERVHARLQRAMHTDLSKTGPPLPWGRTEDVASHTFTYAKADTPVTCWIHAKAERWRGHLC